MTTSLRDPEAIEKGGSKIASTLQHFIFKLSYPRVFVSDKGSGNMELYNVRSRK